MGSIKKRRRNTFHLQVHGKRRKKSFSFLLKSLSLNNNDHKQQTVVTKEQKKALKCTTPKQTKDNDKVDMT